MSSAAVKIVALRVNKSFNLFRIVLWPSVGKELSLFEPFVFMKDMESD